MRVSEIEWEFESKRKGELASPNGPNVNSLIVQECWWEERYENSPLGGGGGGNSSRFKLVSQEHKKHNQDRGEFQAKLPSIDSSSRVTKNEKR